MEAVAQLERMRRTGSWTSDLSVGEFAAVRGVGFDPVGQVVGPTVDWIGYSGWGSCGPYRPTAGSRYRSTAGGSPGRVVGTGGTGSSPSVGYGVLRARCTRRVAGPPAGWSRSALRSAGTAWWGCSSRSGPFRG